MMMTQNRQNENYILHTNQHDNKHRILLSSEFCTVYNSCKTHTHRTYTCSIRHETNHKSLWRKEYKVWRQWKLCMCSAFIIDNGCNV